MICSTCALPVGFNSAGSSRRFQLQYCRHQRQPSSRLLLKLHCSVFLCYRWVWGKRRNETARRYQERQTSWAWRPRRLKPTTDLGTRICFTNHTEVALAGREEKANERKDHRWWRPEDRNIPFLSLPMCFSRQRTIAKTPSRPVPLVRPRQAPLPAPRRREALCCVAHCPLLRLAVSIWVHQMLAGMFVPCLKLKCDKTFIDIKSKP